MTQIDRPIAQRADKNMFFRTDSRLLAPIHSLLKRPFDFSAGKSIHGPLRQHLMHRDDYKSLIALGNFYDLACRPMQHALTRIKPRLENALSPVIQPDADLTALCRIEFDGDTPPPVFNISAAQYLGHVSLQCQLERLSDICHLTRSGTENALRDPLVTAALRVLMLNEALALCVSGIAKVDYHADHFDISVFDDAAHDTLRATWFARTLDRNSHMSTLAFVKMLADAGAVTAADLDPLIERILDRDLSISWQRLTEHGRALNSIRHLRDAVALVAVIAVAGVRRQPLRMTRSDLSRHGLELDAVANLLLRQAQALETDRFVTCDANVLGIRIDAVSKGLRTYYRVLETEFGERDLLRQHAGGIFFEKTYIRQRIDDGQDYRPHFRTYDGFTRDMVLDEAPNEADVEFIIHDARQRHYYFIQAKHALLGEKAFFEAAVSTVQKDFGKGLHQLREAKRLLESGLLAKTLAARCIDDATPENSSFVLLHNIAQFDFQSTDDGISLYDWATFRNLLKDAECQVGSTHGGHQLIRLPTPLRIERPMTVIRRLLAEHPAYRPMANGDWMPERATTEYAIDDKTIRVKGLGI
ncbi:hypothetical protein WJ30_27360 [Burkholderia diffusa]|nr:hypothetical protein WJ30_27360 [Burkholderia diffusa]